MKFIQRALLLAACGITYVTMQAGTVSDRNYWYAIDSERCHDLPLSGQASGGVLYCVRTGEPERAFVSIETTKGEPAASVLQRLAAKIYNVPPNFTGKGIIAGEIQIDSQRGLCLPGGPAEYVLAGTETGLGIPQAPLFFSGSYDAKRDELVYHWVNPSGNYDVVIFRSPPYFDTNTTICVVSSAKQHFGPPPYSLSIVGLRGKTPSNIGLINVSTSYQEELTSAPFEREIMPNWCSWSSPDKTNTVAFEQGTRQCLNFGSHPFTPDGKPFYQIVKTKTVDAQAGIWRKWLGLVPGHKYRVYVRLNTLAMDTFTNNWSLSFHVAANVPSGAAFTSEQLAGNAPLPDGNQGRDAAQMVIYGPGHTTKGVWVCSTMDIVLPSKVDTITTWLRHSGADSTGVGMDWIKVEDLSISVKSK